MAAFLIAAKAVKASGIRLKGDLLLTAVVGETSREPCDDPPGSLVETKDLGARFLVTHGGVADYVLVAEGTGFSLVSVEAGEAWFKITWLSDQPGYYTPYLPDRTTMQESPNMIVRAAVAVESLERWATDYQKRHAYLSSGGPVVPKAQIGAIRGGDSTGIGVCPEVCSLYLGIFTIPGQNPIDLKNEIEDRLRECGVEPTDVELYHYRRGYEAKGIERLRDAVLRAHLATFSSAPPPPNPATSSMWRDVNIFNEVGIPALTYGPRSETHSHKRAFTIEALYKASCVYARTIVDLCVSKGRGASPSRIRGRMRRLRRYCMVRAVWFGLALFVFVPPAQSVERVRIAVTNYNMAFLGAGVALHRGFFKQEGLEVEIIRMNANVAVAALVSGDIGYTMIFGSIVRAALRGLPVRVTASFIDGSTHALLARPEFLSVKDLKGKTLGIQAHGASDHLAAFMMLRHHGINPEKEIKTVALGPAAARFAALKEGVVDVAVISPPETRKA